MKSKLEKFDLINKTVFLRADLNVPIVKEGVGEDIDRKILSDYKIQALRPTLDLILKKQGRIVLATHLARPEKEKAAYSTEIIFKYLKNLGYKISFEKSIDKNLISNALKTSQIVLLENLRFWPEEKANNIEFAQKLKELAEYYVNDAFGVLHRSDTSITLLPSLYESNKKTIGLLIEKELFELSKIKDNPARPLTLILGGGKVKDKLVLIEGLMQKIDSVILCPALVFTVLKAQGFEIGSSLIDPNLLIYANKLIKIAKDNNVKLIFPDDFLVSCKSMNGDLSYKNLTDLKDSDFGISIGPKSLTNFEHEIINAKTIFFNCAMGFFERPETLEPLGKLLEIMSKSKSYTVIGGGDSVAAVQYFGLENQINFLSTGGGATLEFLSGKILPGLKYL